MVEGWSKTELGELFEIIAGQAPHSRYYNHNNDGIPFLKVNNFGVKYPIVDTWTTKSLRESKEGDILLSVAGSLGFVNYAINASITRSIFALRPKKKVDTDYLFHLLKSRSKKLEMVGSGSAQKIISKPILTNFNISFPESLQEQQKIADILTKVDETIEATENIIAKDERIKKGLMQDLFSKGIDEKGNLRSEEKNEFKDSKLGRIPKEWDIERLEYYIDFQGGFAFSSKYQSEIGIKWLKIANVSFENILWKDVSYLPEKFAKINSDFLLKENDTVVALTRPIIRNKLKIATLKSWDAPCLLNQRVARIIYKKSNPTFIINFMKTEYFVKEINLKIFGTDPPNVSTKQLLDINIPKIKPDEQEQIASILSSIDLKIQREKQELNKLKSIKEGLMQDLLTGNVRVNHLLGAVA